MIALTHFAGGKTDVIPAGPIQLEDWEDFSAFIREAAADAPAKLKGGAGYLTGCTFRIGSPEDLVAINAERARQRKDPLWPDAERAVLSVGYRVKQLVDTAFVLVLDYDLTPDVAPSWKASEWPCEVLAYSSGSYHPIEKPGAWRVFLRLAEPIPAASYEHVKQALKGKLPDNAALRWAGQPAFLPTRREDLEGGVRVVSVPGVALDWRALIASVPAPGPRAPRADDVEASAKQDTTNDARVVDMLVNIWGNTTGHRAFGALGGIMYRMGVSRDRALSIAEGINERIANPHPHADMRVEEAYDEAHEMGKPTLLKALRDTAPPEANEHAVGTAWNMVDAWLQESVTEPAPLVVRSALLGVAGRSAMATPGDELAAEEEDDDSVEMHEDRLSTLNSRIKRNAKGEVRNLVFNTLLSLEMHHEWRGVFAWDDFTQETIFLRAPTAPELSSVKVGDVFDEDRHVGLMQAWFGKKEYHEPAPSAMITAVHTIAQQHPFHAVRAYLEGLRGKWDGVDRSLVEYLGAEITQYNVAVCGKWMISAVARAMVPGVKADPMLILEGRQGYRKSTAIRCLCPDTRWFFEVASREVGSKDFMQDMRGKWLCEIPEVDQLTLSRDESELKALMTRQSDNYRPSYARKSRDFPRQLVFAATTNKSEYLRDETGNRRYWPVACGVVGSIREAALCDDRDQLWAQAVFAYDAGQAARAAGGNDCVWWLDPEESLLAEAEQRLRLEEDPWTIGVKDWLEANPVAVAEGFRTVDVLKDLAGAKPMADLEQRDANRMGKTLRLMGFESARVNTPGGKVRLWRKLDGGP